jgi:ABC-type polysaccharide/polyol phosphate export permease
MALIARQNSALFTGFYYRELTARFAGSAVGFAWVLLGPLLLLGIYSLVLGQLFQQRAPELGTGNYTLFVAIALWPWMMFADGVTRGMLSIQANGSLVKKVAFPHILLVFAAVSAAFTQHLLAYALVLLLFSVMGAGLSFTGVPIVVVYLAVLYLLALGTAALLASLQTMLRDVEQIVSPLLMMLQFLTPVLYPLSIIPADIRPWLDWNPIATVVLRIRENLLAGPHIQAGDWIVVAVALLVLGLGLFMFKRLSPYFEDFL